MNITGAFWFNQNIVTTNNNHWLFGTHGGLFDAIREELINYAWAIDENLLTFKTNQENYQVLHFDASKPGAWTGETGTNNTSDYDKVADGHDLTKFQKKLLIPKKHL